MQSRLPGFHAFRFLNLPHMQYVQEWVSVRFGFLSLHQHLNGHIDFQERVGGWHSPPAQVPNAAFRESGGPFPRGWPWGPVCFAFSLHLFCFLFAFFCFFIALILLFLLFTSVFCDFFQKVSSFGGPQFGSETLPFGWPPVHLAGVSLNIARSSSASRVHLGPPFSNLMLPLSSAQVLAEKQKKVDQQKKLPLLDLNMFSISQVLQPLKQNTNALSRKPKQAAGWSHQNFVLWVSSRALRIKRNYRIHPYSYEENCFF